MELYKIYNIYNSYSKYLYDIKDLMTHSPISCGTIADYGAAKISKGFRKRKSKR